MTLRRNILVVAGLLALTLGLSALALEPRALQAVVFAGVVAGLNAVASHVLMLRADGRPAAFVKLVLGGMALRMLAVLAAVCAGLGLLDLDAMPLVLSLLGHFALFLTVEMLALRSPGPATAEIR
jgi:hypothetical protein